MSTVTSEVAMATVNLKHHYKASPSKVFDAFSNSEVLGQWFGPHSYNCKVVEYDFKVNGRYQIRMIPETEDSNCGGDTSSDSVCAGVFVQIEKDNKIVMTFNWIENGIDMGDTLLSFEFIANDDGTDLVLIHEKLPGEEARAAHEDGWQGSMECLEEYLDKA